MAPGLGEAGRRFLFPTNYPSQAPGDLAGRMAGSGIEVLVLTGVSRGADLGRFAHRPDHVVRDAFALRERLERGV